MDIKEESFILIQSELSEEDIRLMKEAEKIRLAPLHFWEDVAEELFESILDI
jgi:hypothetical protein